MPAAAAPSPYFAVSLRHPPSKCLPVAGPRTKRDKEAAAPPINCRYSRDLGVLQLTVFVIAFGYAGKLWWNGTLIACRGVGDMRPHRSLLVRPPTQPCLTRCASPRLVAAPRLCDVPLQ